MKPIDGWLECKISEGMFPGEYAITSTTIEDLPFSFFVSSDYVLPDENLVKVNLLDFAKDYYLVSLPAIPFENIGQIVRVPREAVKEPAVA